MPTAYRDAAPIFGVADMQRSLRFYRDLLGFEVAYAFPAEGEPEFASLEVEGGGSIGISTADQPVQAATTAIWLYCDDVDAAIGELREAGVPIVAEPADQPWGERVGSVADPDGYKIHIGAQG